MIVRYEEIEEIQKKFCQQRSAEYLAALPDSKLGFALLTDGQTPINGLRHPPRDGTCGWYIWCGETLGEASDFFSALHVQHVYEDHPEIARLMGLPPGYRFLLAGDYVDVWYDSSLLNI
jgi:hypothetical protein